MSSQKGQVLRQKAIEEKRLWPYQNRFYALSRTSPAPGRYFSQGAAVRGSNKPDHWIKELDSLVPGKSCLQSFMGDLAALHWLDPVELSQMQTIIVPVLEETLRSLQQSHPFVFQGSTLHLVGSVAEGSKLSRPDEFDFGVMLPEMTKCENGFGWRPGQAHKELASYITNAGILDEDDYMDEASFFHVSLKELWLLTMQGHLPDGWILDVAPKAKCHRQVQVAGTYHLLRRADNFAVDLDVCFWIPYERSLLQQVTKAEFSQRDWILTNMAAPDRDRVYLILPNDFSMGEQPYRFASSFKERAGLVGEGPESGPLACYRLAKSVAKSLFPHVKKSPDCRYCGDSIVSSFVLKQIVLFMANNHADDTLWSEEQLGNRLLEVFKILDFTIQMYSGQLLTFFSLEETKIKASADCGEDDFGEAPSWGIPDKRPLLDMTVDPEAKLLMEKYFSFLEKRHWKPSEVVTQVYESLRKLRNTSSNK